nr:divalent metal cation transporter [Halostagnicola sp. A56]
MTPSFPSLESLFLAVAMMSIYFSLYGGLYQNYLVREKDYSRRDLGDAIFDIVSAMVVTGLLYAIIYITSAAVLNTAGIIPSTMADMARQLEPLAGQHASMLFGIGLLAAGISSVIVNALAGATLFVDGVGLPSGMETDDTTAFGLSPVKITAIGLLIIGWLTAVVPVVLGASAIDTIIIAATFAIIGLPYFGYMIIRIANDESIMEEYSNTMTRNILAILGYLVTVGIALNYLYQNFI